MPKISYTDKVAPVQPDGTIAGFVVKSIEMVKLPDPDITEEDLKKMRTAVPRLAHPKVEGLKVTLSLATETGEPYSFVDFIYLVSGRVDKLDGLRVATGEEIVSREDYDTDGLIGKQGFLQLTEKGGKNFVKKYLSQKESEVEISK
jgi:hypothetical protein